MVEHVLTVGLFDKDSEKQEISAEAAREIISNILINGHGVFAFTMLDAAGVYKMQSTGAIVHEPSVRLEIAAEADELKREEVLLIIDDIKTALNQESIMYKEVQASISFI